MKKIMLVGLLIVLIVVSGCYSAPKTSRKNYIFNNLGNDVDNENECSELCQARQRNELSYHCDYDSPICDGSKCICKTW